MANIVRRSLAAYGTLFVASAVCAGIVRPHQLTWGASDREACARLPGDNLMPEPNLVATRAITSPLPSCRCLALARAAGTIRGRPLLI